MGWNGAVTGRAWTVRFRRAWPWLRFVFGLGILAVAVWVVSSHTSELSTLSTTFKNLKWWWLIPAFIVEMLSFVSFAGMEYELLRAGGLRAPKTPLLEMTYAGQAMANSLPGGTIPSSIYQFRWFRRFGADATLATWAMGGTLVASVVSLSLVAVVGLGLAAGEGSSLDLVPVLIVLLAITVAIGALFVYQRPLVAVARWALRISRAVTGRPRGDLHDQLDQVLHWVQVVRLNWSQVIRIVAWAAGNWVFDCACFAMMFPAIGSPIPWRGLLLSYGAGQLAAMLPITPGGLGTVEGTITIALVVFNGSKASAESAVFMYRLMSFWLILLIGWALWCVLALGVRRGRYSRQIRGAPVEAGVATTKLAPALAEA
jgi:uncharacterized protein (TIRG00374 family)